MAGALDHFRIEVTGKIALDIGASTGGFTDCLVPTRRDESVRDRCRPWPDRMENPQRSTCDRPRKTECAISHTTDVPEPVDICVIDVSFISLTLILPNAFELVTPDGVILALIKPQFELERADVGRGGIVTDPALHEKAQQKIETFVEKWAHHVEGLAPSAIRAQTETRNFSYASENSRPDRAHRENRRGGSHRSGRG